MKLKVLLLTLSLILSGFTHSAFDFYGVDLGKLKVIEDSQDQDHNEGQYRVNQNIKLKPVGLGGVYPGNFNIQPTNPFWKNTNTTNLNPFGGIFYTEDINSNIPDKDNNDLGMRYQRDMDGNKILGIPKDTLDGGIQNNRINAIHTNVRELDLNQEDNPTAKQPATQLQFVNGEWVEASGNPEARVTDAGKNDIGEGSWFDDRCFRSVDNTENWEPPQGRCTVPSSYTWCEHISTYENDGISGNAQPTFDDSSYYGSPPGAHSGAFRLIMAKVLLHRYICKSGNWIKAGTSTISDVLH